MKKPTQQQQNHWDDELAKHGLGMRRADGSNPVKRGKDGRRRLVFAGDVNDLELIELQEIQNKLGRARLKKTE